jgi:hypothetical protein
MSKAEKRGRKPDTDRRQAVALLLAQGLSFTEIGNRLGITRQCAQQVLKASGYLVELPGICCFGCGTVIVKGRGPWLHNGPVYCLVCLAKTPNALFGQRLKAHRLAAGLTLRLLGERVESTGPTDHLANSLPPDAQVTLGPSAECHSVVARGTLHRKGRYSVKEASPKIREPAARVTRLGFVARRSRLRKEKVKCTR